MKIAPKDCPNKFLRQTSKKRWPWWKTWSWRGRIYRKLPGILELFWKVTGLFTQCKILIFGKFKSRYWISIPWKNITKSSYRPIFSDELSAGVEKSRWQPQTNPQYERSEPNYERESQIFVNTQSGTLHGSGKHQLNIELLIHMNTHTPHHTHARTRTYIHTYIHAQTFSQKIHLIELKIVIEISKHTTDAILNDKIVSWIVSLKSLGH